MLKAILFDLDDTLIDWTDFHNDWYKHEYKNLGGVVEYIAQHHHLADPDTFAGEFFKRTMAAWEHSETSYIAPHLATIIYETALAVGVPKDKITPEDCLNAYEWGIVEGTRLFPDVVDSLTLLRDSGLQLGIITNAYQPMHMRDKELEALGIHDFFHACRFSAGDYGYVKPHPSIFKSALECIGTTPEETVFVGDNIDADIGGAQAAGMYAVLRRTRNYSATLNNHITPNAIIDSLEELPALLDQEFAGWRK